jgi:uncharacterized protein YcbK (DUF882 family)
MNDLSEHFDRSEFRCRCGCGWDTVDAELIRVLEDLRRCLMDRPITINSGCRCKMHNALVGGSPKSQHILGKAADIRVEGLDPSVVAECLEDKYPDRYGIGRYISFTHIDVRSGPPTRWRNGV